MSANSITNSPLHYWMAYISPLFLGFFPGALLMQAQQEKIAKPVVLEYDLLIVRVPKNADLSAIPDIGDWNNPAIRRPLYEKGWRILSEPKLVCVYHSDISLFLGPIASLDGAEVKTPKNSVRFFTKASGEVLHTRVIFISQAAAFSHHLRHLPGQTTAIPLTNGQPNENYLYFLLFKVTTHDQFQVGAPAAPPAGATTSPQKE